MPVFMIGGEIYFMVTTAKSINLIDVSTVKRANINLETVEHFTMVPIAVPYLLWR
jgi:hypothetical protein